MSVLMTFTSVINMKNHSEKLHCRVCNITYVYFSRHALYILPVAETSP